MCFKIVYIILQILLSRHVRLRAADNLSSRARLCAPHYAKSQQQQQQRDRLVHSRESALLSRRAPKRKKGERESSITIGNKSKADATIARRARRGGWPISHPSQPPAAPRGQYDCFLQIQNDTRAPGCDRHALTREFPDSFPFQCDVFKITRHE